MLSQNQVIQESVDEYLKNLIIPDPVDPVQVGAGLLEKTQDAFQAYNAVLGPDEKALRWKVPVDLYPYQIARLILALHPVKLIALSDDLADRSYGVLGMYDPEQGIYDTNEDVFNNLIRAYDAKSNRLARNEVLSILRDNAPLAACDRDPDLIAVENGIFDYRTKTLIPFSPDYVFTKKSHVRYNPNAANVTIHNPEDGTDWDVESWMADLSDDKDVVKLLWEILGAIVRPNVSWNKSAWFFSVTGNNGKGTLCRLMRNLCGEGSSVSLQLRDFGKDFLLEPLIRATAIITDENDVGTYVDQAANLKAVVTHDAIMVNRKFKAPITIRFFGFMVQCLNEMPRVKDKSDSFYRRQLFVPFDKCFTGRERRYIKDDYLARPEVLEYVLYKVLNTDYYQLSEPAVCREALNAYKAFNDSVRQFLDDMLPEFAWDLLPYQFLYDMYKEWFSRNMPSGTKQNKTTFIDAVTNIINDDPSSPWRATGRGTPAATGHRMDRIEYLINKYRLVDWMNPAYHGNNPDQICRPALAATYRGLVRK